MSWEVNFYNTLKGDVAVAAIVGTKVYALVAPLSAVAPYVVYQVITDVPEQTIGGPAGLDVTRVQISAYDEGYAASKALRATISTLFESYSGTWSTWIVNTHILNKTENYEREANLHRAIIDVRVNLSTT